MQVSSFPKINTQLARQLLQPRPNDGHKGTFGHLLLVGGHFGMMGAAILSAEAALRTGLGKLTAHVPETANVVFQTRIPEVVLHFDEQSHQHWASIIELKGYNAIAIGPGIGTEGETQWAFRAQIKMLLDLETSGNPIPLVLDADALNILAQDYQLLSYLPAETILTPHIGELKRICAALELPHETLEDQLTSAQSIATSLQVHVVLKSHQTHVCTNDGEVFQLDTQGNSGMAKAGSGDVLTGIISSLLAQGYSSKAAALLGVFIHHQSGWHATERHGEHSAIASDFIAEIPQAFSTLVSSNSSQNEII